MPVLYRPPTYFYKPDIGSSWPPPKKSSIDLVQESVYRIHQSATILSQTTGFPLFSWADKLIGHKDYSEWHGLAAVNSMWKPALGDVNKDSERVR